MSANSVIFATIAHIAMSTAPFDAMKQGANAHDTAVLVQSLYQRLKVDRAEAAALDSTQASPAERLALVLDAKSKPAPAVDVTIVNDGNLAQALIIRADKDVMVYFRATENVAEKFNNMMFWQMSEHGTEIHAGFKHTLDSTSMLSFSKPAVTFEDRVETGVRDMLRQSPAGTKITLSGFSRGGALAELTASRWMRTTDLPITAVTTYLSPRVGDEKFTQAVNDLAKIRQVTITRNVMGGDPTPGTPPRIMGYDPGPGSVDYFPQKLIDGVIVNPLPNAVKCDELLIKEARKSDNLPSGLSYHTSLASIHALSAGALQIEHRLIVALAQGRIPSGLELGIIDGKSPMVELRIDAEPTCVKNGLGTVADKKTPVMKKALF